jgi:hypothetical protein
MGEAAAGAGPLKIWWKTGKRSKLVTIGLVLLAIWNACTHLKTHDPTVPETLGQITWEFVKAAIGL